MLAELTERLELAREGVKLFLQLPFPTLGTANAEGRDGLALTRFVPMVMKRRGVEQRIVLGRASSPTEVYQPLLKAVGRSRKWVKELMAGQIQSVDELARREKLDGRSVGRLLGLGFLSRRIVEAITKDASRPRSPSSPCLGDSSCRCSGAHRKKCSVGPEDSLLGLSDTRNTALGADGPRQIPTG